MAELSKRTNRILKEQENLNKGRKFSIISRKTGKLLHKLIKNKNPKNVLEIGTSIGYSSLWIASALDAGRLITIEKWKERAEIAASFFKKAKLNIKLIEGDAFDIVPKLKTKFDVVFLDATKKDYLNYLKKVKLNKNALVIADNTVSHRKKMKDFLDYAEKRNAKLFNPGSGITVFSEK